MIQEDYPFSLNYMHIMEIMHVSKNKAYEFMRRADFPKIKQGQRTIIPRDAFFKWFNETAIQNVR